MSSSGDQSSYAGLRSQAQVLDGQDRLGALREEFRIPTKADIRRKTLARPGGKTFLSYTTSVITCVQVLMNTF